MTKKEIIMKRVLSLVGVLLLALLVTGCGNSTSEEKVEKDTYVADIEGAQLEATFSHVGDNLRKVEQTMVYPMSYLGYEEGEKLDDATKKKLTEQVEAQYSEYKDGEGTSLETKFTDDGLELTMTVDLYKADASAISSLLGGGSTDPKNISYKETIADFESQGFKKKES
ncbi:putative secreted lipoprotein [Listeria seeligeri FSL N1-067]|nr:putative secreted lipoprotein [Listeria seeligeri FSL N1-067]